MERDHALILILKTEIKKSVLLFKNDNRVGKS